MKTFSFVVQNAAGYFTEPVTPSTADGASLAELLFNPVQTQFFDPASQSESISGQAHFFSLFVMNNYLSLSRHLSKKLLNHFSMTKRRKKIRGSLSLLLKNGTRLSSLGLRINFRICYLCSPGSVASCFFSTNLPLACSRWVRLTLSRLCPLF